MTEIVGLDQEKSVLERYSSGAKACDDGLCCPVSYDGALLEAIPQEVLDRDYGCGDPTTHVRSGERVLDLGCGGGKACFIASQVVGPAGRVFGVDMNDDMLELARRHAPEVARRIGHDNVTFARSRIQDLGLNRQEPLVADGSIDVIMSNCVLNLVRPEDREQLFEEMFRVLAAGGRAVISDIVSDRDVPSAMRQDPDLWSGCISGAFREDLFMTAFSQAGFDPVSLFERVEEPWRVVEGIEFRSVTVIAHKAGDVSSACCAASSTESKDGCC